MPETFHHLDLHILQGPHAEQRQTALAILIKRMNQLEDEINQLKRINPAKANLLVNELEAVINQAEKIVADKALIDEVEQVIEESERGKVRVIVGKTPEGREIRFELKERLEYWRKFYEESGVDWITLPDEITVTAEQEKEMLRLITEFGFNHMIIIPDNIVGQPEIEEYVDNNGEPKKRLKTPADHYEELHQKMSVGYGESLQGAAYKDDGGFGASSDKRSGLRIIITKEIRELGHDKLLKKLLGIAVEDVEQFIKELNEEFKTGLAGFTESEYLIYQREYFIRTGNHIDKKGWTWLFGSLRLPSTRIPGAHWYSRVGRLKFNSSSIKHRSVTTGCRLVGSFQII